MRKIITLSLVTVAVAAVIVMILLPHTYAQQQNIRDPTGISQSLSEMINSVVLLVGVVVPLIVSGLAYVKSKSQDPKINEAIETATYVGLIATATANKALENKQNIKSLIEFGLKGAPGELRQAIDEKKALIDKLNKEIQATEAQIKRITPLIPGQANADTIPDLPRESDFKVS